MNKVFCFNCETEAVAYIEESKTPLCSTCKSAYEIGQAHPNRTFVSIDSGDCEDWRCESCRWVGPLYRFKSAFLDLEHGDIFTNRVCPQKDCGKRAFPLWIHEEAGTHAEVILRAREIATCCPEPPKPAVGSALDKLQKALAAYDAVRKHR